MYLYMYLYMSIYTYMYTPIRTRNRVTDKLVQNRTVLYDLVSDYISSTPRSWKRVFVVGYSRSGTNGLARYRGRENMGPSNNDSKCVYVRTWRIHSMRRVWGYVNETTGFGNMWFALKMSEPVPYFSLNRMAGRDRGNFLMLRTVLQDFKKSIGIFWINQYFIALRFLNETQRLIAR